MEAINVSIGFDRRLAAQDIEGSIAHSDHAGASRGSLPERTGTRSTQGLQRVLGEIEAGAFAFPTALEDIHMNVESRLREIVGTRRHACTRPAAATTRSLSTSASGSATPTTGPTRS